MLWFTNVYRNLHVMKTYRINVATEKVNTCIFLGCLFLCNVDTILKRKWKNLIILTFVLEKLTKNAYVYHKYVLPGFHLIVHFCSLIAVFR